MDSTSLTWPSTRWRWQWEKEKWNERDFFVAGDKEDQPSAGRVRGCWSLSSTRQSPCSTWLQGDTNPINYEPTSLSVNILILLCWAGFRGLWRSNQDRVAWSWQWAGSGELPILNHTSSSSSWSWWSHSSSSSSWWWTRWTTSLGQTWAARDRGKHSTQPSKGETASAYLSFNQYYYDHLISTIVIWYARLDHHYCPKIKSWSFIINIC